MVICEYLSGVWGWFNKWVEFHQAFRVMNKLSTVKKKSKMKRIRFRIKQRGVRVGFESRSNANK